MGVTVYGRKAIRRVERETGERIVHVAGGWFTTVDHRHFGWDGAAWQPLAQVPAGRYGSPCGLPVALSSCRWLFGEPEHGFTRGLMRGPCGTCGVGCSMLHRADCTKLLSLLSHVSPDYWPRPVHRPQWIDDPRRVRTANHSSLEMAYLLDVPIEALLTGAPPHDWAYWESAVANNLRHQVNWAVAQVAPQILQQLGLDPERYRLVYE
jgi:hypothetical protein